MRKWLPRYGRNWSPYRSAYLRYGTGLSRYWCEARQDFIMQVGDVCDRCSWYQNWDGTGFECKYHWEARKEEEELLRQEEKELAERHEPSEDEDMEEETDKEDFYPYADRESMEANERLEQLEEKQSKENEDEEDE